MKATVSLDSIWNLIQSLSLDNQKWLADKVYEEIGQKKPQKELVFPHIPANREISQEVRNMSMGKLPEGFDFERETEKMWEEWANESIQAGADLIITRDANGFKEFDLPVMTPAEFLARCAE